MMAMNLVQRAYRTYRSGGYLALAASAQRRSIRLQWRFHWSKWWLFSEFLAKLIPTVSPPVLVLSLPRSGSSWIGKTLGRANNAIYLREPITKSFGSPVSQWSFDPILGLPSEKYLEYSRKAFMALPDFLPKIRIFPDQWSLLSRPRRRLVIKEVHLIPNIFLVRQYRPRVVFIVRHPAAVALSYQRLGWGIFDDPESWRGQGAQQAAAQRLAIELLKDHSDYQLVQYEALCADPLSGFRDLFKFADLHWHQAIERAIVQETNAQIDIDHRPLGGTQRNSLQMIDSWRGRIEAQHLHALSQGYREFDLPWYQADSEWQ